MYERWGKRAFDAAAALLLLVALAPVFLAVALAVRIRLGSPVFFVQWRAGRGGRAFRLWKFRSMRQGPGSDAERLDGFGHVLRLTGLDELPQLVNILRGEMSFVGPRPLPVEYLCHYTPRQALRLKVRPGLAGPAVAAGRNAVAWPEKLELGAAYAETPPTLRRDLALLAASLRVLCSGRGAHAPGHATMPALTDRTTPEG
jgi:lipopolysaccharide/colanic/teichoic acid biosynthesis glycosyltransferase